MGSTEEVSTASICPIIPRIVPMRRVTSLTVAASSRIRASSATRAMSCSLMAMVVDRCPIKIRIQRPGWAAKGVNLAQSILAPNQWHC